MTPAEYVTEIVCPTLREFKVKRHSQRLAYFACITVFHIRDYLEIAGEPNIDQRMRDATGMTFEAVRGVCDGAKHCQLKRPHEVPFNAGGDWYRPPAVADLIVADLSVVGDGDGDREFQHAGKRYDIYQCVRGVLLAFQACYMNHLGSCDLHAC